MNALPVVPAPPGELIWCLSVIPCESLALLSRLLALRELETWDERLNPLLFYIIDKYLHGVRLPNDTYYNMIWTCRMQ